MWCWQVIVTVVPCSLPTTDKTWTMYILLLMFWVITKTKQRQRSFQTMKQTNGRLAEKATWHSLICIHLMQCNYLYQWAPAVYPGFLLVTFRTVRALTSFEFSELGRPPLNTGQAEKSETQELPPLCRHAHSFRILSWNSASQPQLFLPLYCCTSSCKYLTLWKYQSVALEPEILWKKVICLILSYILFLSGSFSFISVRFCH